MCLVAVGSYAVWCKLTDGEKNPDYIRTIIPQSAEKKEETEIWASTNPCQLGKLPSADEDHMIW